MDDPKTVLLEHSEAKVKLYGTYLETYLAILSHVPWVTNIFIFDLLAGEGLYSNGGKGSPLISWDVIKRVHDKYSEKIPRLQIWFNDNGLSKIEPKEFKTDRIRRIIESRGEIAKQVEFKYFKNDYNEILSQAIRKSELTPNSKALFFIDPYGYKDIDPEDIRKILENKDNEVLLFLPTSFMYRFANASFRNEFEGSQPLRSFLTSIFGNETDWQFTSPQDFIYQLKNQLKVFLKNEYYVDTFMIERGDNNVYCLFFFTSNILGMQKMLEAKWSLDYRQGTGYRKDNAPMFFSQMELRGYKEKLRDFILSSSLCTNKSLLEFGLEEGFLPKHSGEILSEWKKDGKLEVISCDGQAVRGLYIQNRKRRVQFRLVE